MKAVILDFLTLHRNNDISLDGLKELCDCTVYDLTEPDRAAERIGDADVVFANKTPITRDTIEKCKNLKYIGLFATGFNTVDLAAATEHGITVCNAGAYSTDSVVQHTVGLMLNYACRLADYSASVSSGDWKKTSVFTYYAYPLCELAGKTLGIFGYGSIGSTVAKIASALKMKVIVCMHDNTKPCEFEKVSVDDLFRRSDVLSLHCPLTEETKNTVNSRTISLMKPTAYLINTSRGGVIDEAALLRALNEEKIAGAALDVLCCEPMRDDEPLLHARNITITPHVAWATYEARKRLMDIVRDNFKNYLDGRPTNVVNGEVLN